MVKPLGLVYKSNPAESSASDARIFSGKWFFRHRGTIAHLPLLVVLLWSQRDAPSLVLGWGIGAVLLPAGMALRIWAQSYIHHRLKVPLELTTGGPYQLVRNPLYVGNIMICTSATFLANVPLLAPFVALWCFAVYSVVVRYEEKWLLSLYGEPYRLYRRQVPRWLPRLKGFPRSALWNEFSPQAVRAELHCLLIGLIFGLKGLAASPSGHSALLLIQGLF